MPLTTQKTVGEIAAENPGAVRVFEKLQIDYCCGGNRPFEEVCRDKGLAAEQLLSDIERSGLAEPDRDWTTAPLRELTDHIVSKHHAYLRGELPALSEMVGKVLQAHGPHHSDTLVPLANTFAALKEELAAHMMKEEGILFPFIQRLEAAVSSGAPLGGSHCGSVRNPIRVMEYEHDSAAHALREFRRITGDYTLPADACNSYRALFQRLQDLEADLHVHIHLENNILFPRAVELEARVVGAAW